MSWFVSQLGSREHYAVAAALHGVGSLEALFTDLWIGRWFAPLLFQVSPALAARRNADIPDQLVRSAGLQRLATDASLHIRRLSGWNVRLRRNEWYAKWTADKLCGHSAKTFFSYSYTARQPFETAKRLGMRCILGQIDGAWREERLWREATAGYHGLEIEVDEAPAEYWEQWREETDMADKIVVNSPWSRSLILEAGVKADKIVEIPLVYEPGGSMERGAGSMEEEEAGGVASPPQAKGAERKKPSRRLKALFLGNVVLRKGVGQLFDAIRLLKREPVDFIFAGPVRVHVPNDIRSMSNIRLIGPVDRVAAARLYRESDVFLFPTLSDGFGLTQLEALGHGCPVIASTNCARVIEHRMNGLLLEKVTPESIAESIMELVRNPDLLAELKAQASVPARFHPRHLASALLALEE